MVQKMESCVKEKRKKKMEVLDKIGLYLKGDD